MPWKKGESGNPNGRKPAGQTIVEKFRKDPRATKAIEKLLEAAINYGNPENSKERDAQCYDAVKEVVKRLVPALRSLDHTFGDELAVRIIHSAIKADIPMRDKDGDKD